METPAEKTIRDQRDRIEKLEDAAGRAIRAVHEFAGWGGGIAMGVAERMMLEKCLPLAQLINYEGLEDQHDDENGGQSVLPKLRGGDHLGEDQEREIDTPGRKPGDAPVREGGRK